MEDLVLLMLSLVGSITLIVLIIKVLDYSSLAFRIIFSEGAYDIMLGNRRLTTKPTFEEAKQWLDEHKDDYRKKDKVVYKEKFYDKRRSN